MIVGANTVTDATPGEFCFIETSAYLEALASTNAGACFCKALHADLVPPKTVALIVSSPHRAFARAVGLLFPELLRPVAITGQVGISSNSIVAADAVIEEGVTIEPFTVVGAGAKIGAGTILGPSVVIGSNVHIGRNCFIGAHTSITHASVGDNVIIHPGARIGQDGFGFLPSAEGHLKIPQAGYVRIGDNVEIGACTAIDRGAIQDTRIGEGTKIDNLVQIAHGVSIGRGCLIAGQVGIAGSAQIGDFVAIGGQSAISDHVTIGAGAQIGGASAVYRDIPPGEKWAGSPAQPLWDWLRSRSDAARAKRDGSFHQG